MQDHDSLAATCGINRRDFLAAAAITYGAFATRWTEVYAGGSSLPAPQKKEGATVRAVFIYPPSSTFSDDPDGWWSWPGNEFDAEARQKKYMAALQDIEKRLGMKIAAENRSVANNEDARRLIGEIETSRPDGLLLIMFYNRSLPQADMILQAAQKLDIPVVFYVGLGVKHGPINSYRRPGVYFIQSLDNLEAIESGMRMINTRKHLGESLLLSITEAKAPREGAEKFFGIRVRVIPFSHYADLFHKIAINDAAQSLINRITGGAREMRGLTRKSLENAVRAHLALRQLLHREKADGLTMNCLRRGMLKPCISFSLLNGELIPAACENDLPAAYTQLLGQRLIPAAGASSTTPATRLRRTTIYASHCTCATRLYGPEGPQLPYLLRRFAHSN